MPPGPEETPIATPCPTPTAIPPTPTNLPIPGTLPPSPPTPQPPTPQPPTTPPGSDVAIDITIDELINNWPINQVDYGGNYEQLRIDIKLLIIESAKSGNNMSVDQLAFLLATAYDESKIGRDMVEPEAQADIFGYETDPRRSRLCNWQTGDGRRFRGRGFTHITGRCLYTYYDQHPQFTGNSILDNPNVIAVDRNLSAEISVHSMVTGAPQSMLANWSGTPMESSITSITHNEQGKKLSDFEKGNEYDWEGASAIQGQASGQINVEVAKKFSSILRNRCLTGGLPNGISCKQ